MGSVKQTFEKCKKLSIMLLFKKRDIESRPMKRVITWVFIDGTEHEELSVGLVLNIKRLTLWMKKKDEYCKTW